MFNSFLEIGYEHYLLGLEKSADLLIVQNWNAYKRVIATDSGNNGLFYTELMPYSNIETFPFAISKGN